MHIRRYATHVEVLAPAKINLFLRVHARRPDGYHEIETVLVPITVYDSVRFSATRGAKLELTCRWEHGTAAQDQKSIPNDAARELLTAEVPLGPRNLAWRAADLLRQKTGCQQGGRISLLKRIPAAAGLGGASSDAAAVLLAAQAAWQLDLSREALLNIATELGSDVPFFLLRGAAVATGRGERLAPVKAARLQVVVVRPPCGLATPRVYADCQPAATGAKVQQLLAPLQSGNIGQAAAHLSNDLLSPARNLTPWIVRLEQEFQRQAVLGHQMTGSGSSYFAVCRSARQARRLAAAMRARNLGWVRQAATTHEYEGQPP